MAARTPLPTEIILVAALAVTAGTIGSFLAGRSEPVKTGDAAAYLILLTGLFVLRVAGQILVRMRSTPWLPPTEQWALTPYPVLLPTQLAILGLMTWIDVDFARGRGFWTGPVPALGTGVLWFSFLYAGAMVIRYVLRMSRRPDQRWSGGTIPIVFHWVLAGYLFVVGSFHASH